MNSIANSMCKGLKGYVVDTLTKDFYNNEIWSCDESLIWVIQDYLASCEPTKEDIEYLKIMNLIELLEVL